MGHNHAFSSKCGHLDLQCVCHLHQLDTIEESKEVLSEDENESYENFIHQRQVLVKDFQHPLLSPL